jgi:AraC-like DNA-binding protein
LQFHEQIAILKQRVAEIMDKDRPYLDPSLNLKLMADQVGINIHELSLVLNQGFGKNFYTYINELRTNEAVRLLKTGHYARGDMQEVAIRSGFNSRTTFYAAFKKIKGQPPASYIEE